MLGLEFANAAIDAFDRGYIGQYGPYVVEIKNQRRIIKRGDVIEIIWPLGNRVNIIGPDMSGNGQYVGRLGWALEDIGENGVRVVPDGQGWVQHAILFDKTSIELI